MGSKLGMNGSPLLFRKAFIIALTFLLLFSARPAWAAEGSAGKTDLTAESAQAFLDAFFASDAAKSMYTGAAAVIVKDGEIVARGGYGYANKAEEKAVDPDTTVFRLASVSKTFTAVAVMQLAEQGKLDLAGDIRQYLPDGLEFANPFDTPVTVADLLTHRSGFAPSEPLDMDMVTDFSIYVSLEDYAKERVPSVVREPGSAYMYDNYAYLLLGLIVQNVSGQPYETYMAENVFEPLGMTRSGFELKGGLLDNIAIAYDPAGEPYDTYFYLPNIMPHGGMLATAGDVTQFMLAFLNDGEGPHGRILTESSVQEMEQYRSLIHPLVPDTTYGFEAPMFSPQVASSTRVITKYGDLPGNSSILMFIPEEEVGVFLTYNSNGVLRNMFYEQFMGTFFPEDLIPLEAAADFVPDDAAKLARYEGLYVDLRTSGIVSRISVAEQDGQAFLTIHDAFVGTRPLEQISENLFVDSLTRMPVAFGINGEGQVIHLREGALNPLGYAKKAPDSAGFADVPDDDPYAPYIRVMQSLGLYPNDASQSLRPEQPLTRAELARDLLVISGLTQLYPRETYSFADIAGHELAPFIQYAADMGMVLGDGKGNFHPDRLVTRQEAAVMVWNMYRYLFPLDGTSRVELAGEFDPWAADAIRMAVAFGLHGPEVAVNADGAADFRGKATLTRQEAAAFYCQLIFQPVQQMAIQLMQQAQAE